MAAGTQPSLAVGGRRDEAAMAVALAQLLDRLGQRLTVHRVAPVASHWPEHAVAVQDPHGVAPAVPPGWAAQPRPVLLLRRPVPLEVVIPLPEGPLSLLRLHGLAHRLHQVEGPLRLEPEWWRDRPNRFRRDYYRVELASGARLWICRSGAPEVPRWLLHGHLP